ncbi:hypothetical protein BDE27_0577 [Xenorhabdus ehlersii]|uniref:Luciferase n=1 Tax=Xenorhabdus ehlersii TaxID=290111 RepID=A0A2D0IQ90_9GAMM|nr:luciferase [Xenorhabdus ehlersii]RKE92909.1 hypothetical protein BDE27_0577 [Xenorhabdus ehlersii]
MSKKAFDVFLPIAKSGWIISKNIPPLDASYKQNREAAILADQIGLDFIMSMGKWCGFGGDCRSDPPRKINRNCSCRAA